jgi:hypothetical protein
VFTFIAEPIRLIIKIGSYSGNLTESPPSLKGLHLAQVFYLKFVLPEKFQDFALYCIRMYFILYNFHHFSAPLASVGVCAQNDVIHQQLYMVAYKVK